MILGFKPQFVDKILSSSKIHTIREDKHNRWKAGNKIQFATGVRTKNYKQFLVGECKSVEEILIDCDHGINVWIGGEPIEYLSELNILAKNDGFDSLEDFSKWFNKGFIGEIIHWTNFRYKEPDC